MRYAFPAHDDPPVVDRPWLYQVNAKIESLTVESSTLSQKIADILDANGGQLVRGAHLTKELRLVDEQIAHLVQVRALALGLRSSGTYGLVGG